MSTFAERLAAIQIGGIRYNSPTTQVVLVGFVCPGTSARSPLLTMCPRSASAPSGYVYCPFIGDSDGDVYCRCFPPSAVLVPGSSYLLLPDTAADSCPSSGTQDPQLSDTANAVLYACFTFVGFFGGSVNVSIP